MGQMRYKGKVEYAQARRCRNRNKHHYRLAHWPIWAGVFFLAPGWTTFALFDHGLGRANGIWLFIVLVGTGIAGLVGLLPGTELRPYILRFDEVRPNPIYRRVCYTFAWNAIVSFTALNMCGLLISATTGQGYMREIYQYGYPPLCAVVLLLGVAGVLPRAGSSTENEGLERRQFFAAVWAVTLAQILLLIVWKLQMPAEIANPMKLLVFSVGLIVIATAAYRGLLPRTRPIVPGEFIVAD
jgi:hypothetical protein